MAGGWQTGMTGSPRWLHSHVCCLGRKGWMLVRMADDWLELLHVAKESWGSQTFMTVQGPKGNYSKKPRQKLQYCLKSNLKIWEHHFYHILSSSNQGHPRFKGREICGDLFTVTVDLSKSFFFLSVAVSTLPYLSMQQEWKKEEEEIWCITKRKIS